MPKKILYESAVHQFLWAGRRLRENLAPATPADAKRLADWINALAIENPGAGQLRVAWTGPTAGNHLVTLKNAKFYTRGDAAAFYQKQTDAGLTFTDDRIMAQNVSFFDGELRTVLTQSGLFTDHQLKNHWGPPANADAAR